MRRPVRFSIIAISVVFALFTLPIGVSAQKKRSKRKHRTARTTPIIVAPPVFSAALSDDGSSMVNSARPSVSSAAAPSSSGGGFRIESSGDTSSSGKRIKGRISTEPVRNSVAAGFLIISEFRLRGPNGANDEFIEIYNDSGLDHTVSGLTGTGYGVAASDGVLRCTIPNGTIIPAGGHFLCTNSVGYSYSAYPSGNATTATGDATYAVDIPDNAGIALFQTNVPADFAIDTRFDAVGSTLEANTLYKEGTGYPALATSGGPFNLESAWTRDECGKSGAVNVLGPCTISTPKDTDNNASDFYFVDINGTSIGGGQRLGAPGPQNLSSPVQRNDAIPATLLDPCAATNAAPNRVRDFTSVPANNATFGTLSIRRTFTNNTGGNVTRLRFRIIDLDTFPAAAGFADLRPMTSTSVVVTVDRPPCGSGTSNITVEGTTLEVDNTAPSLGQPNGGGFNSSMSAGTITLGTPLADGASIDVQFLLGIQQTGNFRIYVNIEALPVPVIQL